MSETKQRILDAAESLFAEQGYGATSLRHIIAQAGVNLAAIHYHFGTKEALLDELLERRIKPVNECRLAMLDQLEAEANGGPVAIERVLDAFLMPAADMAVEHPETVKLMARVLTEGLMPVIVDRHFKPMGMRFVAALRRALPDIPEPEFFLRVEYMMSAMAHTMTRPQLLNPSNEGSISSKARRWTPEDIRTRVACFSAFVAAGLRAPAATAKTVEVAK